MNSSSSPFSRRRLHIIISILDSINFIKKNTSQNLRSFREIAYGAYELDGFKYNVVLYDPVLKIVLYKLYHGGI